MCGIAGVFAYNNSSTDLNSDLLGRALQSMHSRGPDNSSIYSSQKICLGHNRLSIIDTSTIANQPFADTSGRYTLVFNGEIYNFRELRKILESQSYSFSTQSDTEVLLNWLIEYGMDGLKDLQGFFAFAFLDNEKGALWLVKDRIGVKPLYYFSDPDKLVFASEMKAMMELGAPRNIDRNSLAAYLHLNYIPGPWSIFEEVKKLSPGHYLAVTSAGAQLTRYYQFPTQRIASATNLSYDDACHQVRTLLQQSVEKRLVADVPVGTFLSGGIDSSIITAIASKHTENLSTFSIGFKDHAMYDESAFARLVAKMHRTQHNEIMISTEDLLHCMPDVLNYCDEPFADSSALAVYILSRETRKQVKVVLSGDGADELFGGYYKHHAEWKARHLRFTRFLGQLYPLLRYLPQSRNSPILNKIRQLSRFSEGLRLGHKERYWRWAGFTSKGGIERLLRPELTHHDLHSRKDFWLHNISTAGQIEEVLLTDMQLILPYDMMTKADMMSMANSLEVREPYLDNLLVDFVMQLPVHFLIDNNQRKKILRDAFRGDLPPELLTRAKKGFEVPLLDWFKGPLRKMLYQELLDIDFLEEQKIFNVAEIHHLVNTLFSNNPGDTPSRVWGLLVFQHWHKKYIL